VADKFWLKDPDGNEWEFWVDHQEANKMHMWVNHKKDSIAYASTPRIQAFSANLSYV
jgi:hypothetical protein